VTSPTSAASAPTDGTPGRASERGQGPASDRTPANDRKGLGTFGGVFTPSILTILGVIMYLRLGWVVGNVGLGGTLLIVTIATSITFLTGLSVAAIATDQRVRVGGAYYMISRSLGLETGGAVGIPLFLAQGLSVALYTVGFAESLVRVFPTLDARWTGIVTTLLVAGVALVSARAAIRAQYFIMGAIALSLLSLLFGSPLEGPGVGAPMGLTGAPVADAVPFWAVFAVFFPAVTGIMAGVGMSGDLEDAGKSLPRGTLAAIGVGFVIYMALPIILVFKAPADALIADPLVMRRIAWWGDAILLGVWGATLSSAVGSILGAPRVLQALARDGVLPGPLKVFGRGSGEADEPRLGTLATLALALVAVWLGDLNVIAPILTMFFLTTYGVVNIAAGLEKFLGSPSFRPRFKVPWIVSIAGAVGCVGVMFLINAVATGIAFAVVLAIFLWLERQGLESAFGDVRRGMWLEITRQGLLRVTREAEDARNWRPHLLVLTGAPSRRWHLVELADQLGHGRGLLTVATVVPEDLVSERRRSMEASVQEYLYKRGVQALVRVAGAPDRYLGAERLVEAYGLGPLTPNTVMLGVSKTAEDRDRYCGLLRHLWEQKRNVVVVRDTESPPPERARKRIDIWWGGLQGNGALLMILGYLLRTSIQWRYADTRLKMVVPNESAAEDARANLERIVAETRTGLECEILVAEQQNALEVLRASSADADLVLAGMRAPDADDFTEYYRELQERTVGMPRTMFVLAAEEIAFRDVLLRTGD
jgi:amino acid transporter